MRNIDNEHSTYILHLGTPVLSDAAIPGVGYSMGRCVWLYQIAQVFFLWLPSLGRGEVGGQRSGFESRRPHSTQEGNLQSRAKGQTMGTEKYCDYLISGIPVTQGAWRFYVLRSPTWDVIHTTYAASWQSGAVSCKAHIDALTTAEWLGVEMGTIPAEVTI